MKKQYTAEFKGQVVQEFLRERKTLSQLAAEYGVHQTVIADWRNVVLKGLPSLFDRGRPDPDGERARHERRPAELHLEIGRLAMQVAWMKGMLTSEMSRAERFGLVGGSAGELPLASQAELLGLNRTGRYYQPVKASREEVAVKHRIDSIYTEHPFYGSRRIAAQLERDGIVVNREAVQRHMREMGIAGICRGAEPRSEEPAAPGVSLFVMWRDSE